MTPLDLLMKGAGPGLGETAGFAVLAAVLIGAALASVLASRTFHAVMFLGAVLVAMGALFILLGSANFVSEPSAPAAEVRVTGTPG